MSATLGAGAGLATEPSPNAAVAALEVRDLRKRFGELRVLEGIDLTVAPCGVHSVIGPNGAGKTTLFNCITGALHADAGSVALHGRPLQGESIVARVRLGLVRTFQVSRVFESLSASENVRLALQKTLFGRRLGWRIRAGDARVVETRRAELLAEVGLPTPDHERPMSELSLSDRRVVEVAMALACQPTVLCLDEPTAGIGIGEAQRLADLIGRLGERLAVLLIEHRMSLVQDVSARVTVLAGGAVLAEGTPAAVARDPRVQSAYLGGAASTVPTPTRSPASPTTTPTPGRTARTAFRRRPAVPAGDLVLEGVHSYYGSSHVLHGIDMVAAAGRVCGVLGRNGAGKTTTLLTITNLVRARAGSIRLGGAELVGRSTHEVAALGVALVPEDRWVFGELTVEENLRLAAGARAPLDEAFEEFPALAERRHAKGSELSGGQQQMVAFARAMLQRPQVVLLDEPTQGLSPQYVGVVIDHVRRLRERGVTVILVEQNLQAVAALADAVYLIADGQIAAQLAPERLSADDPVVQQHLLLEQPPHPTPADVRPREESSR
jgi:branched-chain amino acid transport system ATP-binding protein